MIILINIWRHDCLSFVEGRDCCLGHRRSAGVSSLMSRGMIALIHIFILIDRGILIFINLKELDYLE